MYIDRKTQISGLAVRCFPAMSGDPMEFFLLWWVEGAKTLVLTS
jgi:hypothetical protein